MPAGAFRWCPATNRPSARLTPDGGLELRVGVHSHGQGMETTLAQVAHEMLGIDAARVRLILGDTAMTPYSTGTWGSRSMVMAGGAVATACRELGERAKRIGAKLLQHDPAAVVLQRRRGPRRQRQRQPCRKSRIPGIAGRRICRPTSIPAGSK